MRREVEDQNFSGARVSESVLPPKLLSFHSFSLFEQRTLGSNAKILILMGDSHK